MTANQYLKANEMAHSAFQKIKTVVPVPSSFRVVTIGNRVECIYSIDAEGMKLRSKTMSLSKSTTESDVYSHILLSVGCANNINHNL